MRLHFNEKWYGFDMQLDTWQQAEDFASLAEVIEVDGVKIAEYEE